MSRQDPFYELKGDIDESIHDLKQKMTRYHGLQAGNPERRTLSQQVQAGCQSITWQLDALVGAVDRAAENPANFNLTNEELSTRRRWIDSSRKQVDILEEALQGALAAPPPPSKQRKQTGHDPADDRVREANDRFVGSEAEKQALVMRQQDESLDDIEQAVSRIGRMGRAIGEELDGQSRLLGEVGDEMDITHSRLRAAQKRMADIIRSSGGTSQLCVVIVLSIILAVLVIFAFS